MHHYQKVVREIAEDRRTGALALTQQGAEALRLFTRESRTASASVFLQELADLAHQLVASQPAMVSFRNLVVVALQAARAEDGLAEMRQQVAKAVQDFADALAGRSQEIARKSRSLIPEGAVVVTHSHSGTVEETLLFAGGQDTVLQVICSESRPMNEGKTLAARLAGAGISVTLVTDAALGTVCHDADLVLVGADAVTPAGVTNKVGTYGLALAAQQRAVPVVALAGSEKLWPEPLHPQAFAPRDPAELWPDAPRGVDVAVHPFDTTPLSLITNVVTEMGSISPDQLLTVFQERTGE